jgi:hypothetical protein
LRKLQQRCAGDYNNRLNHLFHHHKNSLKHS